MVYTLMADCVAVPVDAPPGKEDSGVQVPAAVELGEVPPMYALRNSSKNKEKMRHENKRLSQIKRKILHGGHDCTRQHGRVRRDVVTGNEGTSSSTSLSNTNLSLDSTSVSTSTSVDGCCRGADGIVNDASGSTIAI